MHFLDRHAFAATRTLMASVFVSLAMLGDVHADPTCWQEPERSCPGFGSEGHSECYAQSTSGCEPAKSNKEIKGTLVDGRGTDLLLLTIRRRDRTEVRAYCPGLCEAWSEMTADGNEERIKKAYLRKRVLVTVRTERNEGRLPGADDLDEFLFVKKISFVE